MLGLLVPGLRMGGSGAAAPIPPPAPPVPEEIQPPGPFAVRGPVLVDHDTLTAVRLLWLAASDVEPVVLVDHDTLAAVRLAWQEDAVQLPILFDRPPGAGWLKSTREARLPRLYAHVACELVRRELIGVRLGARGAWHDYRKVTITVYGPYDEVVPACRCVLAVFNLDTVLAYPSGARFMRWLPEGEVRLEPTGETRDGYDVWRGVLEADVWSIRST